MRQFYFIVSTPFKYQNPSTILRWCEPDFFIKFNYVVALTKGVIYKENAKITINFITKSL